MHRRELALAALGKLALALRHDPVSWDHRMVLAKPWAGRGDQFWGPSSPWYATTLQSDTRRPRQASGSVFSMSPVAVGGLVGVLVVCLHCVGHAFTASSASLLCRSSIISDVQSCASAIWAVSV
jgi:hypothetical protein